MLADLAGRPMLAFQLARLRQRAPGPVVVATSTEAGDDEVARLARQSGASVFRGSEHDVLDRFAGALTAHPADVVVRLTADCPLVDPAVVAAAVDLRAATGADLVTNGLVRTFPVGLDVEVMTATALRQAAAEARDPAEREHVTPFVHRRPERFRLRALRTPALAGEERWTVDTADDLGRVRTIVALLDDPLTAGWETILEAAGRHGDPPPGSLRVRPATAGDDGAMGALWSADPLGTGEPGLPPGSHLDDPAVRT